MSETTTTNTATTNTSTTTTVKSKTVVKKYTKEQFLKDYNYRNRKDLLNVILKDGVRYCVDEVEKMSEEFLNKPLERKEAE